MQEQRENPGFPEGEAGKAMLERMNKSHSPLRRFAFSCVQWKDHMHILDIGCGGGAAIRELLDIAPDSVVEGIDQSPDSVKATEKLNADQIGKRVFVRQGNIQNLPYENGSFDAITAIETVYFWPDVSMAVRGVKRILKEGGMFLIICEGSDPASEQEWAERVEGPFRIYTPEELETFMRQAGFSSVRTFYGEGQSICVEGIK